LEEDFEVIDSGKLYMKFDNGPVSLTSVSDSSFTVFDGAVRVIFVRDKNGKVNSFRIKDRNSVKVFERYNKPTFSVADLKTYAGTYISDELDVTYRILAKGGGLIIRHRRYADGTMKAITKDQFTTGYWWMWNINFTRDKAGVITGFQVDSGRILGLKFRKVQ